VKERGKKETLKVREEKTQRASNWKAQQALDRIVSW